ncbi:MAG: rhomboid family protein, partial [Deltaproteobacteria bacterium]|nr:rhomboid family protein [Deltaproteobacteria bacterium]
MKDLALQRCNNHGQREAVARCPKCRRYFCRECITE